MTFSDPTGWPATPPTQPRLPEGARAADRDLNLPPLPTLEPLPALKPMKPMPRPPWEAEAETTDPPATWAAPAPHPPAGHPAARFGQPAAPEDPDRSRGAGEPYPVVHQGADSGTLIGRHAGSDLQATPLAGAEVHGTRAPGPARAQGLRVLVIGGSEPLGGMIAERLMVAGHRLALHDVTVPATGRLERDRIPAKFPMVEPISLQGDRSDSEDVVHTVARAEVALGGLDAIVVLPARPRFQTSLDADAVTWADEWSAALTTEVLAAACASHIAARSFLARRRAGRIVLVANGRDNVGALPTSVTRAAINRLGADLTQELGPHGIGVSVVTTGPGGTQDFAMTQVADVVDALLATPVLTSVTSQVG